jgi:type III restriction enzyme
MCYGPEFISKTLLAAHSIAVARDAWIGRDYPPVLWLVPTTTIRRQTVDVTTADLSRHLCVFVATIQTLRVENTEGRKVYPHPSSQNRSSDTRQ